MAVFKSGQAQSVMLRDFSPDLPPNSPGIILDAINAIPTLSGFRPMNNLTAIGDPLPNRPAGAIFAYYSNDTTALFAACTTGSGILWRQLNTNTGVWQVLSGPTVNPPVPVRFTQFGDDVLMVGNFDHVYYMPNRTNNITALTQSPAQQTVIAVAGLQAMAFGNSNPPIQWNCSGAGDDTAWTPSVATLANNGPLADAPGPIVAAVPLYRNIVAFKKNVAFLGTQSGAPFSWSWQLISPQTGTWSQGCAVQIPDGVAFIGMDDFYVVTGYAPQRLPNNVKQWFFRTCDMNYITATLGWFDETNSCVWWHFVSVNAPAPPTCDMYVSYNLRSHRWCVGHQDVSMVPYLQMAPGAVPNPSNPAIIFDGNFVPKAFTGGPGGMSLTTGFYGDNGRLSQLMKLRPLYIDYPDSASVTPIHCNDLGQPGIVDNNMTQDHNGAFYGRQYARWHQWIHATKGDCEVTGYTPEFRVAGVH
jgi:hypothetical protein